MSKILLPLFSFALLVTFACHPKISEIKKKTSPVNTQIEMRCAPQFPIKVGTNLSGWLSTPGDNADTYEKRAKYMQKSDIKWLAEQGFDHVRIPVDEALIYDEDGAKVDSGWQLLRNLLVWVAEEDMRAIFDLHNARVHNFDTEVKTLFTQDTSRQQFFELWEKLQVELREYPNDFLAYEILNEPIPEKPEQWNVLFAEIYLKIRETEPERVILIGGTNYSNVRDFGTLEAPANDSNIILTFHFYEPYIFTHYKTSWSDHHNYVGQSEYPGNCYYIDQAKKQITKENVEKMESQIRYADRNVMDSLISIAIKRADDLNLPLYAGEFGVFKRGPSTKFRYNWYRDVVDIIDTHGIPHANWDYKAQDEFGLRLEEKSARLGFGQDYEM